jgi:hypothetical protein
MCDCDFDPPSIYKETYPKAKKEHRCGECRRIIDVGENYLRIEAVYDGRFVTNKMCDHCEAAAWAYRDASDCCFAMGSLWSDVADFIDDYDNEGPHDRLEELLSFAKAKWMLSNGQIMPVPKTRVPVKGGA